MRTATGLKRKQAESVGVWQRTGEKTIHWNKLSAILSMKWGTQFSKNFISMPLFSVGITVAMTLFYGSMAKSRGGELEDSIRAMALSLGALMNTTMTGILCTGMALAEEKEKHTLRALMTSSVNGLEFFLGSTLPVAAMIMIVNILLVPASGLRPSAAGWVMWLTVSALCSIASTVVGMIFGICCKSQVSASTVISIPILILVMIPVFAEFSGFMEKISRLLFTGVLSRASAALAESAPQVDIFGLGVIGAEILLAALVFVLLYRENGYERD